MQLRSATSRAVAATAAVLALASCAGGPAEGPVAEQAPEGKVVEPGAAQGASGEVTVCGIRDTGVFKTLTDSFNARGTGVTARYVELGQDTDAARAQAIQRLEGGSAECDIYLMDVTWVSEWAAQGWVQDQTKVVEQHKADFIPATLETARYAQRYWATPFYTNAGLLFYRNDRVQPPTTWKQVYEQAARDPRNQVEIQAKQYEGLTVNFLEMLYSAGGSVLDEHGNVTIDSPQTRAVLNFMAEGVKSGAVDRAGLTYNEDGSRRAYESGVAGQHRNWPSAYKLIQQTDAGPSTAVAPLPAFDEASKPAAVLGGWNFGIATASDNPGAAVAFIDYASSAEFQKTITLKHAQAPVVAAIYDDPEVQAAIPFITQLKQSVLSAKPRPKSPVYAQISKAIYSNVYPVIAGEADVATAVPKMAADIKAAQETF
ncbi:ABC transporter substrate-binding protein [Saccharopolyspora sp. K220]|uniref:ABC transporter substrate-binding protein n=1 Tax=Saccharopolyspora soli TaxID=2926618 RepID=UPI001F57A55B|nr:ABC transporter substrate-binding protein [Saccharopolyspora soli]MCI2421736.1 ABC transporter substrate-binding protein [Saccharopolyspora soli]